jgi:hypothetical protein
MAGAGVRVFEPGEVLSSTFVNTYLMDQAVCRFADAAARDAAFGGVGQPTLSEGRICYLNSTNSLQYYSGASWVGISAEAITGQIQAKGDLIIGTAPTTAGRVAVGVDGYFLTADSTTATGVAWSAAAIADGTVTAAKLASDAVTTAKIAALAVTAAKLASDAVTTAKILDANVTAAKLASDAVTTVKILDANVTQAKLATGTPQAGFRSVQNAAATASSNYTIQLTDLGKLVELNEASACTLTIPTNASVAFTVGDRIDVLQVGAGQITITPVSGTVTINGYDGGLKLNGQWAAATLVKRATNTWVALGNLTT